MKESEIYLITLIHTLGFLKEEVSTYYPDWRFHEGVHGFVTYRLDKNYSLEDIRELSITFSLCKGQLLFKGSKEEVEAQLLKAKEKYEPITIHRWDLVEETGDMGDRKNRGTVLDVIHYDQDQYALGVRFQIRGDFAPYNGTSPIPMPERSPSCAYQKLGEAFKHFRPLVGHEEVFLDIGCSPGGSTYYLLNKGFRVIGVDPEPISPVIREDFSEGFLHVNQPFSELKVKHLKGLPPVNWVVLDIDQSALDTLPAVFKLMNKLDECVGLILTVKMDKNFSIADIAQLEEIACDFEYKDIRKSVLPSHDKEFCFFATKPQ